ncbi:MAG: DUF167 domain-containing protein [Candidatus Nitrospinota bacterium M3_3B_026]
MGGREKLDIRADGDGARFAVHAAPRASRPGLAGVHGGALKARLAAPPVEGAANEELVALLAKALGTPKRGITIVSGHASKRKTVKVDGMGPDDVLKKLGV